jgi:hypothetical protein
MIGLKRVMTPNWFFLVDHPRAKFRRIGRYGRVVFPEAVVCTENLIRVDAVMESPKLAE